MKKRTLPAALLALTLLCTAAPAQAVLPDVVWRKGSAPPAVLLPGSVPFTDLWDHWAAEGVTWAYSRGLIMGTAVGRFSPDDVMTRGVFIAALGRLEGVDPSLYRTSDFFDVTADDPYAPYVAWARERGLVQGREDGAFDSHEAITRQELAALIVRYLGKEAPPYDGFAGYADAHTISPWAQESVEALRRMGIMTGSADGTFGPFRTITRGECSILLQRLSAVRYPEI